MFQTCRRKSNERAKRLNPCIKYTNIINLLLLQPNHPESDVPSFIQTHTLGCSSAWMATWSRANEKNAMMITNSLGDMAGPCVNFKMS